MGDLRGETGDWDQVARGQHRSGRRDGLVDEHGRDTYLSLVEKWADLANSSRVLKTDLFDVAFASRPFLFDLAQSGISVVGIDVSGEVVRAAKERAEQSGFDTGCYLQCDVRGIPLREDSIDLIVSDSTLDHFPTETDIVASLKEMKRVLRPGGVLILTIDNESNLTYPPYVIVRLWMRLGLAPYFIGKTLSHSRLRGTLEDLGFSVDEITAIFHCPHPDAMVRWCETLLRRLSCGRLDGAIRRALVLLEKLGSVRTRYLTGRYIAVKAVKQGPGLGGAPSP